MKTKVMMSVLMIMVAALLVTGATMALFTSEAAVEANVLTAGKLELTSERPQATLVFNVDNIYPGAGYQPGQAADDDSGEMMVTDMENTGSLPFYLKAVITETGASPGAGSPGYLPGKTNLFLTLTGPEGEVHYTEATLETLQGTDLVWQVDGAPLVIGPGEAVNFRLFGQFDISAGNEYQESTWEGTVTFTAVQSDAQGSGVVGITWAETAD